jgi:uncharacterized protein YggE
LTGKVLDEGIAAGANVAGQRSFGLREETAYRHRALQAAVNSAHSDAEFLAHAIGATLRGTTSMELLFGGSPVIERRLLAAEKAATPIEPGTLTISASVRMVYKYEKTGGRSKGLTPAGGGSKITPAVSPSLSTRSCSARLRGAGRGSG